MTFNNFNSDHTCNCFDNAFEDVDSFYAIKTNKDQLRSQDFNSYWDKGRRSGDNNCEEICSLKGVSISIFNEDSKEEVKTVYQQLFKLAPGYKPHLSVVKFYHSSGMVKSTPSKINKHHYDLYKSDDFDYSKVELIEVNELH
jgi:hypothetical protein